MTTAYVYALSEPGRPECVRYIGQSTNPVGRLRAHISKHAAPAVLKWIGSLKYQPHLEILAKVDNETEALLRERDEIVSHLKAGHDLLNERSRSPLVELKPTKAHPTDLGRNIAGERVALGITQAKLARDAKVAQAFISQLETGARKSLDAYIALRIAKVLGVTVEFLLTGETP
jgi:plasmid maintenance system antidote protein VapI